MLFQPTFTVKQASATRRRVYLTFDDGPDATWTPRILDILAEWGVRATFFMIGEQVVARKSIARRVLAEGHEIGNHSWSHRHPWAINARTARQEVQDGATAIADVLGHPPAFYRPPHGRLTLAGVTAANQNAQSVVLWNRTAIDWGYFGRAAGIQKRLSKVAPGDIVLMHDGARTANRPEQLITVLPQLLESLQERRLCPAPLPRFQAI